MRPGLKINYKQIWAPHRGARKRPPQLPQHSKLVKEAWAQKKEDNSQLPQHSENMREVKTELNFYFHFQKKKATTVTHKGSLGRKQPLNIKKKDCWM